MWGQLSGCQAQWETTYASSKWGEQFLESEAVRQHGQLETAAVCPDVCLGARACDGADAGRGPACDTRRERVSELLGAPTWSLQIAT